MFPVLGLICQCFLLGLNSYKKGAFLFMLLVLRDHVFKFSKFSKNRGNLPPENISTDGGRILNGSLQ